MRLVHIAAQAIRSIRNSMVACAHKQRMFHFGRLFGIAHQHGPAGQQVIEEHMPGDARDMRRRRSSPSATWVTVPPSNARFSAL